MEIQYYQFQCDLCDDKSEIGPSAYDILKKWLVIPGCARGSPHYHYCPVCRNSVRVHGAEQLSYEFDCGHDEAVLDHSVYIDMVYNPVLKRVALTKAGGRRRYVDPGQLVHVRPVQKPQKELL